nr:fatty acyl-CoA reductase wat-like [Halyomorpha halys]
MGLHEIPETLIDKEINGIRPRDRLRLRKEPCGRFWRRSRDLGQCRSRRSGSNSLQSVIHLSTAFSNCNQLKEIKEKFYETPISSDNLIHLSDSVKEEQLELMSPHLRNKWPNTYVFTKAVAEEAISKYGKGLPIAIFRPVIVISTKSDPIPGWSDNLYGPQGLTLGTGAGIVRVVRCDPNSVAEVVPADYAVNCLLAVGYKTSSIKSNHDIQIYNFSNDPSNKITWGEYVKICDQRGQEVPLAMALWYCSCILIKSSFGFFLLTSILHNLPALIVDTGLFLMNKKPRAMNIYRKIHKLEDLLSFFAMNQWDFERDNTKTLWKSLSETDKQLFPFDMKSLDFNSYLNSYVDGMRLYLGKDDVSTIPRARRINKLRYVAHRSVQLIFSSSVIWCLWRIFSLFI